MNLDKVLEQENNKDGREKRKEPNKRVKEIGILAGVIVLFFVAIFFVFSSGGEEEVELSSEQQAKIVSNANMTTNTIAPQLQVDMTAIKEAQETNNAEDNFALSPKAQLDAAKQEEYIEDMKKYLNSIKKDISLLPDTSFIFQNKQFFIGENLSNLKILEIGKQHIRFSSENWEYTLRFFERS